uniref:Peptidase S1 domain-containing protein n=1 Tax=Clastoptera arizonana TaxID=38151 RepID=A0A1B6C3N6_9HEMI
MNLLLQVIQILTASSFISGSTFLKTSKSLSHGKLNIKANVGRGNMYIVNGQAASPGQIPYQVAMDIVNGDRNQFCGGSLITSSYIVTAAHCVYKCDQLTVLIGATDLSNATHPANQVMQTMNGTSVITHPAFTTDNFYYDIAVVKLQKPVTLSDTVGVIRLPTQPSSISGAINRFIASGWGKTSDVSDPVNKDLSYITVPYLDTALCQYWFWENAAYQIVETQMCTDTEYAQATCRGDSGGPVAVRNIDGTFNLVGVISLGVESCEELGVPNIHTDVYENLDFIKANTDYKD